MITEQQMKNLQKRPNWTKEEASYFGRMGGLKTSIAKKVANVLNATKHGNYLKDETVKAILTPTKEMRAMGWTFQRNLDVAKSAVPLVGARNATEGIQALGIELGELKALMVENENAKRAKQQVPSPFYRHKVFDSQMQLAKMAWGYNDSNNLTFIQSNIENNNTVNINPVEQELIEINKMVRIKKDNDGNTNDTE